MHLGATPTAHPHDRQPQ